MAVEVPTLLLSSMSAGRFMLRPAGPRAAALADRHRDDFYMFGIMLDGQQTLSVDFRDITIRKQEAVVVSPGQVHRPLGDITDGGFGIAFPSESMTETEISVIEEYSLRTMPLALGDDGFNAIKALYEILLQRKDRNTDVEFSIASAIKGIVLQLIPKALPSTPGRYLRIATDFRQLLKENIRTVKSPSVYASMLSVSGVYLNEAIKNTTGMSASAYIISYVILEAKRRLAYTGMSAQEIAYLLGYEDYAYFSRLFRRHTGMSLRVFRQKYLE